MTPDPDTDEAIAAYQSSAWAAVRGLVFLLLGFGFLISVLIDLWVVVLNVTPGAAGADGLSLFFPMILALLCIPAQLFVVLAFVCGGVRRAWGAPLDTPMGRRVGLGVSLGSTAGMGFPALVYVGLVAVRLVLPESLRYQGPIHDVLWTLAEPMTLVWAGLWTLGAIGSGIALGLFDRYLPIGFLPLWPLTGALYMVS